MAASREDFTRDKWQTLTLAQQLGNVGSDFERSLRWKARKQSTLFQQAAARTLEQLDLTLTSPHVSLPRRREIARLREEVCRELFSDTINEISTQQLQRYFLAFATAARKSSGL